MTALPSHKDEAFRYSDHKALAEVWDELARPREIRVTKNVPFAEVWMPSGEAIDVRRASLTLEAGAGQKDAAQQKKFEPRLAQVREP